jgi:chromosomal replication initiator protein
VAAAVAKEFRVGLGELQGRRRASSIRRARHAAMHLCRSLTNASLNEIGAFFGNRSHSTVLAALRRPLLDEESDEALLRRIRAVLAVLHVDPADYPLLPQQGRLFPPGASPA